MTPDKEVAIDNVETGTTTPGGLLTETGLVDKPKEEKVVTPKEEGEEESVIEEEGGDDLMDAETMFNLRKKIVEKNPLSIRLVY